MYLCFWIRKVIRSQMFVNCYNYLLTSFSHYAVQLQKQPNSKKFKSTTNVVLASRLTFTAEAVIIQCVVLLCITWTNVTEMSLWDERSRLNLLKKSNYLHQLRFHCVALFFVQRVYLLIYSKNTAEMLSVGGSDYLMNWRWNLSDKFWVLWLQSWALTGNCFFSVQNI